MGKTKAENPPKVPGDNSDTAQESVCVCICVDFIQALETAKHNPSVTIAHHSHSCEVSKAQPAWIHPEMLHSNFCWQHMQHPEGGNCSVSDLACVAVAFSQVSVMLFAKQTDNLEPRIIPAN